MEQTKIDVKILKNDSHTEVDQQTIANAIFVEDSKCLYTVSQITLSGKHNGMYTVVTYYTELCSNRVVVDNNLMIICMSFQLVIVDLRQNKLLRTVFIDDFGEFFGIYKFKAGYFLHGEVFNYFVDSNFKVVWFLSGRDIFANPKVKNILEIFDDYITVFDWLGDKYYYNESGEFKVEYYPEYSMSD